MVDIKELKKIPTREEVEWVVMGFLDSKSPREDNVTYDILKECWGFFGNHCKKIYGESLLVKC